MPADTCFIEADYASIELRILALMSDPAAARRHRIAAKEECLNALMTPTGRYRNVRSDPPPA